MIRSFPFYHQNDQADCGPTCVRMISKYYGKDHSINELRKKSFISKDGVSLLGISQAAEAIGFKTISIKLGFDNLNIVGLPCIIHFEKNHFVVLYKIKKSKIYIADPAFGLITYTKQEFLKLWISSSEDKGGDGIALLLEATPVFYKIQTDADRTRELGLNYILKYIKTNRLSIVKLFFWLLVGSSVQLIIPFLTQAIVDVGIKTKDVLYIYIVLVGQLVLLLSRTTSDFYRRWILLRLTNKLNLIIISDFLYKLMKLPMSFFDTRKIGDILQRVDDHTRVEKFLSSSSFSVLFSFINLVVLSVVLAIYNIPIFMVFIFSSCLYVFFIISFSKSRKELDYKKFRELSYNRSGLIQLINGMQEVKLNNCEDKKRFAWEGSHLKLSKVAEESTRLEQWQEGGGTLINELKNTLITAIAAAAVINDSITLGMMLAIQFIIGQLNVPINESINFIRELQDATISLDRIGEIYLLEDEGKDIGIQALSASIVPANKSSHIEINSALTFENVSFLYEDFNSPYALENINLTIEDNKITAIVGGSGSGKTTLLKLLLKYYPPTHGKVFWGNIDLLSVNPEKWRSRCGAVLQDGYIFTDTIANNISLSDKYANTEKLVNAAQVANIQEFIESLPLKYETMIGEDGSGVSAGQRQRILIARAIYKNPSFLFFDEATSALDASNEKIIMNNLDSFYKGKTVVVIAHRLSTVKNAHKIVVMEKGRIIEQGTHSELVSARSKYYELIKNQLELGN